MFKFKLLFVILTHNIYFNRWQWHVFKRFYLIYLFSLSIYFIYFLYCNFSFLVSLLLFYCYYQEHLDLFGKTVSIGVSFPPQKHHPLFLAKPLPPALNRQTVQAPLLGTPLCIRSYFSYENCNTP